MALNFSAILNDTTEIDGARAFIVIDYSGGNQTVAAAVAAIAAVTGQPQRVISHARGILVTVTGDFEVLTVGRTDAVTLALAKGWHPICVTQVNIAASTGSGFYYF